MRCRAGQDVGTTWAGQDVGRTRQGKTWAGRGQDRAGPPRGCPPELVDQVLVVAVGDGKGGVALLAGGGGVHVDGGGGVGLPARVAARGGWWMAGRSAWGWAGEGGHCVYGGACVWEGNSEPIPGGGGDQGRQWQGSGQGTRGLLWKCRDECCKACRQRPKPPSQLGPVLSMIPAATSAPTQAPYAPQHPVV